MSMVCASDFARVHCSAVHCPTCACITGWNSRLRGLLRAKREGVVFCKRTRFCGTVPGRGRNRRAPFQKTKRPGMRKKLNNSPDWPTIHVQTIFQLELEERFVSGGRRCPRSLQVGPQVAPIISFTPTLKRVFRAGENATPTVGAARCSVRAVLKAARARLHLQAPRLALPACWAR